MILLRRLALWTIALLQPPFVTAAPVESAAIEFTGRDALYDLYQSMKTKTSTPHFVFFTHSSCKDCYVMERMFHQASAKAKEEQLNIQFGVIDCSGIRESCKLNLHIRGDYPDVRYWDSRDGEHIRGIDPMQGRPYRQRRDFPSFVHFARRFSHPFGAESERPPMAYPVVADLARSNFDRRMVLEPEPCYVLKNWPDKEINDWFHSRAVQRHDRNAFFTLKQGDRANTTEWSHVQNLPDGLHIVGVAQQSFHTYHERVKSPSGHDEAQSWDEWINNTPYPGVWEVVDDAELEFLNMRPNKFLFALFMLTDKDNAEAKETLAKFEDISRSETFGLRGTFGIFSRASWQERSSKYGVRYEQFGPGDYHLVIMTQNGTYWYEDMDYITLDAMQTEKSLENLLVGHYPQMASLSNTIWWYARRLWRGITNWVEYAFLGPIEALISMVAVFLFTLLLALAAAACDRLEQVFMKIESAKID